MSSASETDEVESPSPSPQEAEGAFDLLSRLLQTPALSQSAGRISTAILSDYKPPERTVEMLIRYSNPSAEKVILQPTCSKPEGWTIASRIPDTSLPPGEALSQALIAKPDPNATHQIINAQWGSDHLKVPLIAPQLWYTCGPFQNIEMEAFNKPCPCENRLNLKDQFPGRSSVAVRWESKAFRGTIFDVESWFIGGQGAYVIAAQVRFEPGQRLSVIWAHSPGGELRINNELIVRYNDQTEPLGGLGTQYAGTFTTTDADTIMIRIMRHKNPCSRMVLYFLDDRGRVVEPTFVPLDS